MVSSIPHSHLLLPLAWYATKTDIEDVNITKDFPFLEEISPSNTDVLSRSFIAVETDVENGGGQCQKLTEFLQG